MVRCGEAAVTDDEIAAIEKRAEAALHEALPQEIEEADGLCLGCNQMVSTDEGTEPTGFCHDCEKTALRNSARDVVPLVAEVRRWQSIAADNNASYCVMRDAHAQLVERERDANTELAYARQLSEHYSRALNRIALISTIDGATTGLTIAREALLHRPQR
jgi:hypothetical protein